MRPDTDSHDDLHILNVSIAIKIWFGKFMKMRKMDIAHLPHYALYTSDVHGLNTAYTG
jgi:hypothetical protein